MSDNQEKSDDLIAELAKLMASNAQGSESEAKPTVIKLAPLSEATVPSPAPIRIPGMDVPAAPAAPPSPAVRIPGMEKPAGVEMPGQAARAAAAPKAQPTTQFDFGKPPSAAPITAPEPLANWQSREVPKPVPQVPTPAPRPMGQSTSMPAPEAASAMVSARLEPMVSVAPAPLAAPSPSTADARPASDAGSIKFGFGHASDRGAGDREPGAQPQPGDTAKPAAGPEYDPIADLIAAELDAAQAEPAAPEAPKVEAAKPAHVFPASVEVVPARNFGSSTAGQAPVLVAKPVGTAAARATPISPLAFRPLPAAPKPAENDKFAVAPVFGLGSSPAPGPAAAAAPPVPSRPAAPPPMARAASPVPASNNPPKPDTDPMDEIENLIGEAVRVQLSGSDRSGPAKPAQGQSPAAPVVPPLTTGFAPRRAGLRDNEPQLKSAEAAILAAAAATGAEVGRIDSETGDERPYKRVKLKPQKANMFGGVRQYVGLAVAGTLLLAAGLGLYWVLGMGRGDGTAPVLTADATPAKQVPPIATAEVTQPARSVVFDEIDGVAAVDSAETLVSRDETAGASVADVASVAPASADNTESGLANRKVRTVTVRPDGTIVSGDEAVAGTQALPVERPNVPAVPGATVAPSDLLTAAAATNTDTAPAVPAATETAALDPIAAAIAGVEAAEAPAPIEVAALVPVSTTPAVFDASIVAPVPMPRPVDRSSLNAGGAFTDTAVVVSAAIAPRAPASTPLVALADAAAPAAASSSAAAAAYVQLASLPSEAEARNAVDRLQSRYGSLFGGESLLVQRAELSDGRVTYRLRLPASSLQSATQICASIKANGGDCFATNG